MTTKKRKNNLYTQGYFLKRLRDCNFIALKIFDGYRGDDNRKWTILVDPGNSSTYITCVKSDTPGDFKFHLDDGGKLFPKNYFMMTNSIEIIVERLITRGVAQSDSSSKYIKNDSE